MFRAEWTAPAGGAPDQSPHRPPPLNNPPPARQLRRAERAVMSLPAESPTVTKKEIVRRISEDLGLTQLQTKDIVQRTLDAIIQALVSEGRIELRNFGIFEVRRRASRRAHNPRT